MTIRIETQAALISERWGLNDFMALAPKLHEDLVRIYRPPEDPIAVCMNLGHTTPMAEFIRAPGERAAELHVVLYRHRNLIQIHYQRMSEAAAIALAA